MKRPAWFVSRVADVTGKPTERHVFDTEAEAVTWAATDQGKYLTVVFEGWVEA